MNFTPQGALKSNKQREQNIMVRSAEVVNSIFEVAKSYCLNEKLILCSTKCSLAQQTDSFVSVSTSKLRFEIISSKKSRKNKILQMQHFLLNFKIISLLFLSQQWKFRPFCMRLVAACEGPASDHNSAKGRILWKDGFRVPSIQKIFHTFECTQSDQNKKKRASLHG